MTVGESALQVQLDRLVALGHTVKDVEPLSPPVAIVPPLPLAS